MISSDSVGVVQGIYESFGKGDVTAVLERIATDSELSFEGPREIAWAGTWKGRDGFAQFLRTLAEHLDDIKVTMTPFAADGARVVCAGRYQGRVRSTGAHIDSPLVHLWTVRDGVVVGCVEMTNTAVEVAACQPARA